MSNDEPSPSSPSPRSATDTKPAHSTLSQYGSIFSIPPPVKRVFDEFPLVTYKENELPLRAPRSRGVHVLHVFTTKKEAESGKPSFNPACLKWQAYLNFNGITFRTVPSNNHASPSGALPFLLPTSDGAKAQEPVSGNKLKKWIGAQKAEEKAQEPEDLRYEAYASLLDNRIRKAWLYQLYLSPPNKPLLHSLYIAPCSSNVFVQMTIAYQLRHAAKTELVKSSASRVLVEDDIMRDVEEAFEALSTLLWEDEWFFGQEKPGLFDASMFAYAHLILDNGMQWRENRLAEALRRHQNLLRHRERILSVYF